MIQKFIVTIDSTEKISSKEVADALNYSTGSFSLGNNRIESYDEDDEPFGDISDDRLAELAVQFIEEHEILAEFVAYVNRNK